jgi:hypothetical protein
MIAADRVLLLMTPRSKESLWVAAEAGAAWALDKPLIPVLMFVEAQELFEPIRTFQARTAETPEQLEALVLELRGLSIVALPSTPKPNVVLTAGRPAALAENFTSAGGWDALLKVGEWRRDAESGAVLGEGMFRYLYPTGSTPHDP